MFGVPASTQDDVEIEYVYKFFDWLLKQSPTIHRTAEQQLRPAQAIRIADADFDCTLSYSQLRRRRYAGSLGAVGTYQHEIIQETRYREVLRQVGPARENEWETVLEPYTVDLLRYTHQRSASHYDEILVDNLQLRYNIYGDKGVTANIGSDKLLIPLDYYISRTLRFDRKERLYYRSMHFVMNSRVTKTVKWYQTGIFQIVILIIAVAITIFTGGAGSPYAVALASGGYTAVAMLIIQTLVITAIEQFLITKALEVVIKELGYEVGMVLAVVAFVAGAYGQLNGASWSSAAIQASNGLMAASSTDIQRKLTEYRSDSQEFQLMAEEKMEELEEIENLLNGYDLLDPRSFIGKVPKLIPGESPSALYDRTVHVGNPGILQYDYIESFVEINTRLPTFDDLVGETFYGRV